MASHRRDRVPTLAGTWRERMAVRGGPVSHALAASGWVVFGLFGAVVGALVTVVYVLTGQEYSSDLAGRVIGGVLLFVPMGAVLFGLLFGLPTQYAARSWLRTPSRTELAAVRAARAAAPPDVPDGLRAGSRWAEVFAGCAGSVTAFHTVVRTLDDGPAREWFTGIGATLDRELDEALRLARVGEGLEASDGSGGGTADEVAERLRQARAAFAETTDRAARTALDLGPRSDLTAVRAQLDMLAAQVPVLRSDS